VILKHILPNLASSIIVLSTFELARMIIRESFLSFLGLGIQPPMASWGGMLAEGRSYMLNLWWLAAIPGSAIFFTTLGINLMGDGLRDWLDPHTRNR
jgi:peptide/nickel transport system permease protein